MFRCKWVKLTGGGVDVDQKYGIPVDTDLLADMRFLPNPYWVPELRDQTGRDPEVADYKPRKRKDKQTNTSSDEPKRHIVLSGKRNIVEIGRASCRERVCQYV